jgi:hypothetical protein
VTRADSPTRKIDRLNVTHNIEGSKIMMGFKHALWAALMSTLLGTAALAADDTFCGRPLADAVGLRGVIAKAEGVKEIYRGAEYVAYEEAATQAVYTFSEPAQGQAHPAAVCRKPVKEGDSLILQMKIVCGGSTEACQALESDFKLLNARMEADIRNKAASAAEGAKK